MMPSLERLSKTADVLPKVRSAMKSETVNPMPPSIETAAIIRQSVPDGMGASPVLTVSHENVNIPTNLPTTRPRIMARLMPPNTEAMSNPPRKMPALAKAKRGMMR